MTTVVPPDRWAQRHAGHTVTRDRRGHRRCLTCPRTWAVDSVAVQRAVEGDPPPRLTPPERAAAVLVLRGRGLSVRQIAVRVGCSDRTVWRVLSRAAQTQRGDRPRHG